MEDIVPDFIEPTPIIKGRKCRFLLICLSSFITFFPALTAIFIWYYYDFLIGLAFFLFFTLGMGIVISKLRLSSIPSSQREISYSNTSVARWFLGKNVCF